MEIKFHWADDDPVPIPLMDDGSLHHELSSFLVARYYYPTMIRPNVKPVMGGTLRNIAYDLKPILESFAASNISIADATYIQIQKCVEDQLIGCGPEVFNTRLTRIRDFYDFLQNKGVTTKARFPAEIVSFRHVNPNSDMLNYTKNSSDQKILKDPSHKRTVEKKDYCGDVISMDAFGELYKRLEKIDPVYATMSELMLQTFLRVSDVCEMPLHKNKYNKDIPAWPEFKKSGKDSIRYRFMTKGLKDLTINIYPSTLELLYEDYLRPHFRQRLELFNTQYLQRKNATLEFGNVRGNKRRRIPDDLLWINSNGTPIKPYMVEAVFRQTGMGIHPHMLRHTGVTHTLWNYCELHGIQPEERLAGLFIEVLSKSMGHVSLETTLMYLRTIMRRKADVYMPFVLPAKHKELNKNMGITPDLVSKLNSFFKASAETLPSI